MPAIPQRKLHSIKGLMLFSQGLLLIFTVQWLIGQYIDQQEQLRKNLTKIFIDVQHEISDSLYLNNVYSPGSSPVAVNRGTAQLSASDGKKITLSPQGLHKVLSGAVLSHSEEKTLFRLDTIAFNELFTSQMKQNGWNFRSEWINNPDSNKKGARVIFIQSNFFTTENGVVVSNYTGYLLLKLLPQILFVLVLLSLTAAAFWITFRSLRAQIKLGTMKDDFISNMSHELKTPIATVKVALEALNNYNVIENVALSREYLCMASSEMDRLELLATRVLNTSLLESGKVPMQRESYSLKLLVEEVLQSMQLRILQYRAHVNFDCKGNDFLVPVDKLHMQGVLVNLLDNSLKYGIGDVCINIRLSENNGAVQLSLSDNGPGIPEEYREKVFEKFFRVPSGNQHNTKGYGLGLNYAALVMRQHNGSINVNNIEEGGCVFTLTF